MLNLDCLDLEEFTDIRQKLRDAPEETIREFAGIQMSDEALLHSARQLDKYLSHSWRAKDFRLNGEIAKAQQHELSMENIYLGLPDCLKW